MTESNPSAACGFKGLVQARQTDPNGELRIEGAADLIADALDGFIALRQGPPPNAADAPSAPRPRPVAMSLEAIGTAPLRSGELASCRIDLAENPAAPDAVQARLDGPHGAAWQATIRLSHAVPGLAPAPALAAASGPDGRAPEAAPVLPPMPPVPPMPPMRVMRVMRKSHCDQAGHVNVQVFMDLADEAVAVLGIEATARGGAAAGLAIVQARISFKRELFEGDLVTVHSGIQAVDATDMQVVHGIVHQPSGALACVVETRLTAGAPIALASTEAVGDWPSLPRARPPAGARPGAEAPAGAVTTSLSVVDTWDVDPGGRLSPRALVNLCSTGARQYLATLGLTGARFLSEQITVAAVDYLIDLRERPALGCNLALRTAFLSGSAKSIRFSHHLVDTDTAAVYATVEIVGVMLDLKTHRSMEVPADVRERLGMA